MTYKKFALITGASSGIGADTALELSAAGFTLFLVARNHERLDDLRRRIAGSGGEAHAIKADVSEPESVAELLTKVKHHTDYLDVLFNNAGSGQCVALTDTTWDCWNQTIGSCLTGTYLCCKAFVPMLIEASSPVIINNASVAAHRGFPNFAAYSAAKGGVVAFSRALREELREHGIRITVLSAGATDSPFWDHLQGEWDRTRMMRSVDVARTVRTIADLPSTAMIEDITIMPAGGAL